MKFFLLRRSKGGECAHIARCKLFQDVLDTCGFMDLGFTGPEFTWQGVRHGKVIWEGLDRGVAKYDWMAKFPATTVRHLFCISSYQRPLLLLLVPNGELDRWKRKPFRFEELWLADRGCSDIVRQAWDFRPNGHLMFRVVTKIRKCKKNAKIME